MGGTTLLHGPPSMQIDFHHGVTYVCARLSGFDHADASAIAYCAQYVDDAIQSGLVRFDNGALYNRTSSAHKMLDYRNFKALANSQVWFPFHFLPGNGGLPAGQDPGGKFIEKLICRPNSPVAQDMVRECIRRQDTPYSLYRLGITLHVFADTWAHQGFAGVNHRVNEARYLVDGQGQPDRALINRLTGYFISEALPLGHGAVLGHPDKPFLQWGYTNGRGDRITRDNPRDFLEAADHLCQVMQRYRLQDADAAVPGLPEADKTLIDQMLRSITDGDGDARHQRWLEAIAAGNFSFGPAHVTYHPRGNGSWKYQALGWDETNSREDPLVPYHPDFLTSHWKRFHDALQAHRFYITHELLPQYGICVA